MAYNIINPTLLREGWVFMMRINKKILYINLIIFGTILIFNGTIKNVSAAAQTDLGTILSNNSNVSGVDRTVPKGLKGITNWFSVPTISSNDAVIVKPGDKVGSATNKGNSDVIALTQYGDTNKVGAIWAKRDQDSSSNHNYIDVNKKQTMSMWMFFGGAHKSGGADTGDGMALVLQNSTKGDQAFTTVPTSGFVGETLGVWGTEESLNDSSSTVSQRAIDNSWALEFDTYANYDDTSGAGNYFDGYDSGVYNAINHIGANYPASAATYVKSSPSAPMQMIHENPITKISSSDYSTNFLTDDRWHHITLTWTPPTSGSTIADMNLQYDDKTINGDLKTPGASKDYSIDLTKFNLSGGDKLYWGFTGSTGRSTENNLIVFESIPSIVEASTTAKIYDESSNRYIDTATTEDPNRNVVYNGDKLNVIYNLNYLSGTQSWNDIEANIKLPQKIDYSDAKITYTDASGNKTSEKIDLSGLSDSAIKYELAESLSESGIPHAEITFEGTANSGDTSSDVNVDRADASFDGSNLQQDTDTPAFVIKNTAKLNLAVSGDSTISALTNQNVDVKGLVSYSDSSTVDVSKLEVHAKVNGSSQELIGDASDNPFTFTVPADQLKVGQNTVTLYVVNKETHNASNEITFTINVTDNSLTLTVSKNSYFKTVQALPNDKLIERSGDWIVDVDDNRNSDSNWKLSASATALDNDWSGGLVYVGNSGGAEQSLTNSVINIASGNKDSDVSNNWASDTGILLKQDGAVKAGTYSSTISWVLSDSV